MDDFGRTEKKKGGLTENQKGWLSFLAIGAIGGLGAFYLLFLGGEQEQVAKDLEKEILALEGAGYGEKVSKLVEKELGQLGVTDKNSREDLYAILDSMSYKADFSPIKPSVDGKFGVVEMDNAKITSRFSDDTYTDISIRKTIAEPNKYFFNTNAESRQLIDALTNSSTAWMVTNYDNAEGFVELKEQGGIKAFEAKSKKAIFKDGSGSIEYASVEGLGMSFSRNESDQELNFASSFNADKIEMGQALKFMLGNIKPMKFAFDMEYEGDTLSKLEKISQDAPDLLNYFEEGAEKLAKEASAAEKFSGHFKLNKLALSADNMGFETEVDLNFQGFPYQPMPKGELTFKINDYAGLINYLGGFFPIQQDELDANLLEANEYFTNEDGDLVFSATFDGSRVVKLGNGKEIDVVKQFKTPPVEYSVPSEPEAERFNSPYETPVKSDSKPIALPQVEQKPL